MAEIRSNHFSKLKRGHETTSQGEISVRGSQWEKGAYKTFVLDVKGEERKTLISINAKGGDCWQ